MSPVRGRERRIVVGVLLGCGTASGALSGALAGSVWTAFGLSQSPPRAAGALIGFAIVLDAARVRAASIPRQVPIEWSRLLPAAGAAALYGTRLGIGPLTFLRTWLWWASALIAATGGPAPAALVGATFGAARMGAIAITGDLTNRRHQSSA